MAQEFRKSLECLLNHKAIISLAYFQYQINCNFQNMAGSWHIADFQLINILDYNNYESMPTPCQMLVTMDTRTYCTFSASCGLISISFQTFKQTAKKKKKRSNILVWSLQLKGQWVPKLTCIFFPHLTFWDKRENLPSSFANTLTLLYFANSEELFLFQDSAG